MIAQHFIYVCTKNTVRRTYGGANYTMAIYENKGKGKIEWVAKVSACTSAHMGEDSEVFSALLAAGAIRPAVIKQIVANKRSNDPDGYYHYGMREQGLTIQSLGGA